MKEETNNETVLKYVDAFNRADIHALRQLFTEDAVVQGVLGWGRLDQVVPVWEELHAAFAIDLQVDAMIIDGDQAAVRYTERGKSVGRFRGKEPTGRAFEVVAMEWFELREGLIHRRWGARDHASQLRQMGLD